MPAGTPSHAHLGPGTMAFYLVTQILTSKGLPTDIAQQILAKASFLTGCSRSSSRSCTIVAGVRAGDQRSGGGQDDWMTSKDDDVRREMGQAGGAVSAGKGEALYLCSMPIGCASIQTADSPTASQWLHGIHIEVSVRETGWKACLRSKDWNSESVVHVHTWLELSLLRDGKEAKESRGRVKYALSGLPCYGTNRRFDRLQITLDRHHPLVLQSEQGDRIILWGKAKCQGWTIQIKSAMITLLTAPFPAV